MVVFRKGGKVVRKDCIQIEEDRTKTALPYSYLGITLQISGTLFSLHIKERTIATIRAMQNGRNIGLLSVSMAVKLLPLKMLPVLTCGYN